MKIFVIMIYLNYLILIVVSFGQVIDYWLQFTISDCSFFIFKPLIIVLFVLLLMYASDYSICIFKPLIIVLFVLPLMYASDYPIGILKPLTNVLSVPVWFTASDIWYLQTFNTYVVCSCLIYSMWTLCCQCLDFPFLITHSVISNIYLIFIVIYLRLNQVCKLVSH